MTRSTGASARAGLVVALCIALLPLPLLLAAFAALLVGTSALLTRPLSDVLAPDPAVTEIDERAAVDPRPATIGGVFNETSGVDLLTKDATGDAVRSVVKIERVVDVHGDASYRVILPSTQDWQGLATLLDRKDLALFEAWTHDQGATTDLDSNLALVLFPELRTQYERAVLAAMADAGIRPGPDGDPVMLVGFSQGGLLAAHLAARRSDAFDFRAIIVAGAPIDSLSIPPTTTVISVQHEGDVVARPDGIVRADRPAPREGPHWLTIFDAAPGPIADFLDIHNAKQYNETLDAHLDEVVAFDPELQRFFPGKGATSTQTKYSWHE